MAQAPPTPEPRLLHTLACPTGLTRTWASRAHPDPRSPLLATAAADKQVHVWDLRTYSLVSSVTGGHKRSVRCVGWKDFGQHKRRRTGDEQSVVLLATGSFDANCGLWTWRRGPARVAGEDAEQDFTTRDEDEDEDWHFSTLLTGPDSEIKDLEFSPPHYGANFLATCSRDKSVWVWEEVEDEEWETVAVLSEHAGDVKCVAWCSGADLGTATRKKRRRGGEQSMEVDGEENEVIGCREILASGSYDDTIRLWRDVEEEGDWTCVGIIEGHEGTVWDLKWEGFVNLDLYPEGATDEDIRADWEPRMISCSDDLSIRLWRRELSESEREKKRERALQRQQDGRSSLQTGFASSRIPSVIRPASSLERWTEECKLPQVHVRSVYAVDWSRRTGLVVSCGGDGTIAVYKEVKAETQTEDVVMNGTTDQAGQSQPNSSDIAEVSLRYKSKWIVVALVEAAHDEYEINHVCWAPRRDRNRGQPGDDDDVEEIIVSTADDGNVKIWELPSEMIAAI